MLNPAKRVSAAFADRLIEPAQLWHQRATGPLVGSPRARTGPTLTILVPNSLQSQQGLHAALEAFARVRDKVPDARLHLYGAGGMGADLAHLIDTLELHDSVECRDSMPSDLAPDIVTSADVGSVTMRAASSGTNGASERIMEFVSRGVPVLMSRADAEALDLHEPAIHCLDSANTRAIADAILEIIQGRHAAGQRPILNRTEYLDLIDSLSTETFDDPDPTEPARHRTPG
jgi:glycosyltransferase involved in cell wall biosynthesis